MKKLKDLLSKYKNLRPPPKTIKEESKKILEEILGISPSYYEVEYKKPDLVITCGSSVLKNEIFLKKSQIMEKLKERLGSAPLKIWFK